MLNKTELDQFLASLEKEADIIIEYYNNNFVKPNGLNLKYTKYALKNQSLSLFHAQSVGKVKLHHGGKPYCNKGVYMFVVKNPMQIDTFEFNDIYHAPYFKPEFSSLSKQDILYIGTSSTIKKRLFNHCSLNNENAYIYSLRLGNPKRITSDDGKDVRNNLEIHSFQLKKSYCKYYKLICPFIEAFLHSKLNVASGNKSKI